MDAGISETRRPAVVEALVARSPSGALPVPNRNGKTADPVVAGLNAHDDEQALADRDRSLADRDQTTSDGDQTLSDTDQTSSDSDQTAADRDQAAADRDQVASDRDLAAGGDPGAHDVSQVIRERTAHEREQTAARRMHSAQARLAAAEARDAIADMRDVAALARDLAAVARDQATTQAGVDGAREDGARARTGAELVMRAAEQRRRAAGQREQSAQQRLLAAEDRLAAEDDREQAALERRRSLVDREMLVGELRREQVRREEALRHRDEALGHQLRAEQLAHTLQRSLSPPSLPGIAGLDVAVHYEPSAPEEVGGDFYDIFPLAAARSGFFVGDVCGKGPEAAAITSLARYTMRTAAMLHEEPAEILMDLNAALLMHDVEAMQTCAAVYGQVDVGTASASITLAVAGHPPPLVVRANGTIETTRGHGTVLGAVEDPVFETCEVEMGPGDAIVVCSDGILDTLLDGVRVDEQRVAGLLAGTANASAQDLADRLVCALQDVDRPLRDDVAIMALRRTPA
jgi:serine phosphatase RsbU (regulator of sigma subunit)